MESYRLNALATSLVQDCVDDMRAAFHGSNGAGALCMCRVLGRLETMLELAAKYAPREPEPDACEHCGAPPRLQQPDWYPNPSEGFRYLHFCFKCGAKREDIAALPRVSPPRLREQP